MKRAQISMRSWSKMLHVRRLKHRVPFFSEEIRFWSLSTFQSFQAKTIICYVVVWDFDREAKEPDVSPPPIKDNVFPPQAV